MYYPSQNVFNCYYTVIAGLTGLGSCRKCRRSPDTRAQPQTVCGTGTVGEQVME